jgi:hypothetical protein
MRHGKLSAQDFLITAVATSYPENQDIAYKVAWEILFGETPPEKEKPKSAETSNIAPLSGFIEGEPPGKRKPRSAESPNITLQSDFIEGEPPKKEKPKSTESSDSGIGSGSELIREWRSKICCDKEYGRWLMERAERIAISSNSKYESTFLTKESFGPLDGDILRHFSFGEDSTLIDFEETIDNILSQGKSLSCVRYEDFIVRERGGQRKAVVILQDISGSMGGVLECSLICTAMMCYVLQKHETAVALFESDAHIVKRFFDKKSVEETIEEILSARVMGGTMGANVSRWTRKQLEKVNPRYYERECIMISDFGFFDTQRTAAEIKELADMDVKVIIILPPASIYETDLDAVTKKTKCTIVELDNKKIANFPEVIGGVI